MKMCVLAAIHQSKIMMKIERLILAVLLAWPGGAIAEALPQILSSPSNSVPGCVTPQRLMNFVMERNRNLDPPKRIDPRFSTIASEYESIGECVQRVNGVCVSIRWDYAFFQMLLETNYLTFTGGVKAEDNNFAGIGATVAGKAGERFSTIREGVLAHLQHVLMYSGQIVQSPVAHRTKEVQLMVHDKMNQLGRPVTFTDLSNLWTGTDRDTYATSIERTSQRFRSKYCSP